MHGLKMYCQGAGCHAVQEKCSGRFLIACLTITNKSSFTFEMPTCFPLEAQKLCLAFVQLTNGKHKHSINI